MNFHNISYFHQLAFSIICVKHAVMDVAILQKKYKNENQLYLLSRLWMKYSKSTLCNTKKYCVYNIKKQERLGKGILFKQISDTQYSSEKNV